jgi:hypothetical protein
MSEIKLNEESVWIRFGSDPVIHGETVTNKQTSKQTNKQNQTTNIQNEIDQFEPQNGNHDHLKPVNNEQTDRNERQNSR